MRREERQMGGHSYATGPEAALKAVESDDPPTQPEGVVRLNFNVSAPVASEVRLMAEEMNISMTQLFRYAFSILKIAITEARKNRKLVIADEDGRPLREIVLPS